MLKFLQLLTKRPSDKDIRKWKVIIGIMVTITGVVALYVEHLELKSTFLGMSLSSSVQQTLPFIFIALGIIPIISGLFDINIVSRGWARLVQVLYGFTLIMISGMFIETPGINITIMYFLLGLVIMIIGVSGKFITEKGRKTGQKITKIRV